MSTTPAGGPRLPGPLQAVADRVARSPNRSNWVLVTALAGTFSTSFPFTILAVALRPIAEDLHTSTAIITWAITAPILAGAVSLPVLGKLGDLYGHRRTYLLGFTVATVAAVATALSWNAGSLIGFRVLAQVTGSATVPASMAVILSEYEPQHRVRAMAYYSFVIAGAPAIGLGIGGPIVNAYGWRPIFVIQAVLSAAALIAAVVVLRETERQPRIRFDLGGAAALALGAGCTLFGLNQGGTWGWTHPAVLVSGAVAPLAFVALVRIERRVSHPILPLELFRDRNFSGGIATMFFVQAAYMGAFVLAPILLQTRFGYTVSASAFVMLLRPGALSVVSPVGGAAAVRFGERRATVVGAVVTVVAMVVFTVAATREVAAIMFVGLLLQGGGNGFAQPALTALVANAAGEGNFGIAAAAQQMIGQIGSALGITVLILVLHGANTNWAFGRAYLVGAAIAAVGVALATTVRSVAGTARVVPPADDGVPFEAVGVGAVDET